MAEEETPKTVITPLGDTIYNLPRQDTVEGVETSRLAQDILPDLLVATQIDLSDTSVSERLSMTHTKQQRHERVPPGRVAIATRAVAKTGTEILDNFDSLLGGLSYVVAMLCAKSFESGKTTEGIIFAAISVLLIVAKHRLPPGWITEILNAPAGEIRVRMAEKYKDIEQTFKG